jgi:hypothetical protein
MNNIKSQNLIGAHQEALFKVSSTSVIATSRRFFLQRCLGAMAAVGWPHHMVLSAASPATCISTSAKDNGYRGIWFTLGQQSEHGDKYSGGLGTYTANHVPMAIYAKDVNRTFFVYGGAKQGQRHLLAMASYYDHHQHLVPRPTIVHDKQGVNDPHDNPSLCLDGTGHLWVFISGRGRQRPGLIYRGTKPHSTDEFELIGEREFTYPQPRWLPGEGFFFLFTKYTKGRELYFSTSPDGRNWSPDKKFAGIGGHYQTSHLRGHRVITAFNMHPGGNVDQRTNLYYLQSDDLGKTWRSVRGEAVELPLSAPRNPALVRDYQAEKQLVYIHDLDLDAQGRPAVLFNTSNDFKPGPKGDPRWLTLAHWLGDRWDYTQITRANHNYSTGSLYLEKEADWHLIGPTEKGPQPIASGGEIAIWRSQDEGRNWRKQRHVTRGSARNHNYVRRPMDAHPDFHGFWADGNPDQFSMSALYFTNATGDKVWQLPYDMDRDFAEPTLLAF